MNRRTTSLLLLIGVFLMGCGEAVVEEVKEVKEDIVEVVEDIKEVTGEVVDTAEDVIEKVGEAKEAVEAFLVEEEEETEKSGDAPLGNDVGEEVVMKPVSGNVLWQAWKVVGEHDGSIEVKEGSLTLKGDEIAAGAFVIDMTSIKVLDLEGGSAVRLADKLKGADFFQSDEFPEAKMVFTEIWPAVEDPGHYNIVGDLTIRDVTLSVDFVAITEQKEDGFHFETAFSIDRTLWGIRYGSAKFFDDLGDKAIKDEIGFVVKLVLK